MATDKDIAEAEPYGSFPSNFSLSDTVKLLQRPYTVITQEQFRTLTEHPSKCDVFIVKGRAVTFGDAGGGKALMPVSLSGLLQVETIKPAETPRLPTPEIKTYQVNVSRAYYKSYQGTVHAESAAAAIDAGLERAQDGDWDACPDEGTAVNIYDENDRAEVDEEPTPTLESLMRKLESLMRKEVWAGRNPAVMELLNNLIVEWHTEGLNAKGVQNAL